MIDLKTAPYAALALRVATGLLFLSHGLLKVFVFTIPGTIGFFESLGLPGALAYGVILAEILGGLALILGVGVRAISVVLAVILLGATWTHSANGWVFSNEGGGWEFPLFWAGVQMSVALIGPGAYAVKLPWPNAQTAPA